MTSQTAKPFAPRGQTHEIERGKTFTPKFDADGLIGAIVTDRDSGNVLMFAHMNTQSLRETIASGYAHFWSRSRGKLWRKGEESGNLLRVVEIRTDCDQDVLWIIAHVEGAGVACHTGAPSCFYRRLNLAPGDTQDPMLENAALPSGKAG
ncbi:MAG TPA: phosphoribosyl-AMP cyclohydrolase [Hyphomicrobium sp.]|nr:phosphoribosyl-AMP cyclohydrolase [Hyphomicrobium sp.]